MRPHGRLGLPVLCNAACARNARCTTTTRPAKASSAIAAPAAPPGEPRSPSANASTVEAISRYPTMNGSSLATSAGIAENEPNLGHRVSAHTTPQDTIATVHQYPTGIRNSFPVSGHATRYEVALRRASPESGPRRWSFPRRPRQEVSATP